MTESCATSTGKTFYSSTTRLSANSKAGLTAELTYEPGNPAGTAAKGILAVAYLLDSMSDAGNYPIDASAACGLARVLEHYAETVRKDLKAKAAAPEPPLKIKPLKLCLV